MSDLTQVAENVRNASQVLRAYMDFRDQVGVLMLALVEKGDPSGLVLLEMLKSLEARTGEFSIVEESG